MKDERANYKIFTQQKKKMEIFWQDVYSTNH